MNYPKVSKKKFMEVANKFGFIVTDDWSFKLGVEAPQGKVFAGQDIHYRDIYHQDGYTKAEAMAELHEDMKNGVETCTQEDCDFCNGY